MFGQGTYEYVSARTKYFDALFKQALQENIPQIVILGAGFDSRAIRFKASIRDTHIFELDAPLTQQHKKKLLRKAKVSVPKKLSFVPINFDKESMKDALSQSGYEKKQKSLFIMEGLTYYVSEKAIKDTLYFIKNYSRTGSAVAFDYFYQSFIGGKSDCHGAK